LIQESTKHTADVIAAASGLGATITYYMDVFVNPLLTATVSLLTIIWLYHRIKELRIKNKIDK